MASRKDTDDEGAVAREKERDRKALDLRRRFDKAADGVHERFIPACRPAVLSRWGGTDAKQGKQGNGGEN